MSFHPQPNEWTCGPFALKHALIALGRPASGEDLTKVAHSHWWSGTDEVRLARAAESEHCELPLIRHVNVDRAKLELNQHLRQGHPVLLCVDSWEHWIAVLNLERDHYVVLDSLEDPVLGVLPWRRLYRRWRYLDFDYDDNDPPEVFEMFPVIPHFRSSGRASFTVDRIRFLRRPENRDLALHWNDYLEDLLTICRPRTNGGSAFLSVAEFLRRNGTQLVKRIDYWHGTIERKDIEKQLSRLRFVAETYGLVIPLSAERSALTDVTVLMTMWAVASQGVGEIYGAGPR